MSYLFTSESVSEGHPDKVADQISDAVLDELLKQDPDSKVACEVLVTTGLVVLGGELRTRGWMDIQKITRDVITRIGYNRAEYMFEANSCGILSALHEQSPDIRQGVDRGSVEEQGAGDQGMMFGYAVNETENYMPLTIDLAHLLLRELAAIRREGKVMTYLRPDSKSQVTVEYDDNRKPIRIHTIVVSTQHDDFDTDEKMQQTIRKDVIEILIPRVKKQLTEKTRKLFTADIIYHVNPTGKFVIGGPHGDSGVTGRKIIVDTYGGRGAHGGGAFSGKDSSKVDRSAAYAARHIAKNLVAAGIADEVLVQVAYAIGVAHPVSFNIDTFGTAKLKGKNGKVLTDPEIAGRIKGIFDMRPGFIVKRFGLKNPIFSETASYGHLGRKPFTRKVEFQLNGKKEAREVEFFAWEKTDCVQELRKVFGLEKKKAEIEMG
ncbi:MAG: methionine adenosyltransferase [Bacteroidetes bacterium]|nr:methionine adenosyltransferase [Bacteroidota bacterium]